MQMDESCQHVGAHKMGVNLTKTIPVESNLDNSMNPSMGNVCHAVLDTLYTYFGFITFLTEFGDWIKPSNQSCIVSLRALINVCY
jgi:hypothetical protein